MWIGTSIKRRRFSLAGDWWSAATGRPSRPDSSGEILAQPLPVWTATKRESLIVSPLLKKQRPFGLCHHANKKPAGISHADARQLRRWPKWSGLQGVSWQLSSSAGMGCGAARVRRTPDNRWGTTEQVAMPGPGVGQLRDLVRSFYVMPYELSIQGRSVVALS